MKVKQYIYAAVLALVITGFGCLGLKASNWSGVRKTLPSRVQISYPLCPPDTNPPVLPQPDINPLNPGSSNPFFLNNPPGIGQSIIYDPETNTLIRLYADVRKLQIRENKRNTATDSGNKRQTIRRPARDDWF